MRTTVPLEAKNNLQIKQGQSLWYDSWCRLRKNPTGMFGLILIIILIFVAILAPVIAPYDPNEISLLERMQSPSKAHLFGTDNLGRDLLSRVIYGARISISVGFFVQFITVIVGVSLGAIAGYFGGKVDMLIMRFVDIWISFPDLLFIIAMRVALGPGLFKVFLALSIVGWTGKARLVRGQVLAIREKEYIESARALGLSTPRVIIRHILPNCMAPIIISVTMGIAGVIMAEAGLSFLGLGVQEPIPSWGSIINEGMGSLRVAPWYTLFPGLAIAMTVLGFNLLGDGLRDALDPRMKE